MTTRGSTVSDVTALWRVWLIVNKIDFQFVGSASVSGSCDLPPRSATSQLEKVTGENLESGKSRWFVAAGSSAMHSP